MGEHSTPRSEEDVFRDIASKVSEVFPEYVLIIKTKDGSRAWKFSDTNWAVGAMHRAIASVESEDFLQKVEEQDGSS